MCHDKAHVRIIHAGIHYKMLRIYLGKEETFDDEVEDLLRIGGVYTGLSATVTISSFLVAIVSDSFGLTSCFGLWEVPFNFTDGVTVRGCSSWLHHSFYAQSTLCMGTLFLIID